MTFELDDNEYEWLMKITDYKKSASWLKKS